MIWHYRIYIIKSTIYAYILRVLKYNIIHVYPSKYVKRMQVTNYIILYNYLNGAIQSHVVLYLYVPGI